MRGFGRVLLAKRMFQTTPRPKAARYLSRNRYRLNWPPSGLPLTALLLDGWTQILIGMCLRIRRGYKESLILLRLVVSPLLTILLCRSSFYAPKRHATLQVKS